MKTTALAIPVAVAILGSLLPGQTEFPPGWKLTPAGRQVATGTMPMSSAVSKDGRWLLVLHAGIDPPSIAVLRTDNMTETGRVPLADAWLGLTFSPDGKSVYAGGGASASVYEFRFSDGTLTPARTLVIAPSEKRTTADFVGDVAVTPSGRLLYVAGLYANVVHVINLQSGTATEKYPTGRRPYRILFHPDGSSYFVTSWTDGGVYQHRTEGGERLGFLRLGPHTTDMVWRARKPTETSDKQTLAARLFVSAANTNRVYSVGIDDAKAMSNAETIDLSISPKQPAGMTPSGLALNGDASRLFIACAGENAVAVVDVSEPDSTVLGYIPAGAYPLGVQVVADNRVVVLNGRSNTLSVVDRFADEQLVDWSEAVIRNSPYRDEIPAVASAARRVVYIVKGDLSVAQATGATAARATPNHHRIAHDFVSFSNFRGSAGFGPDDTSWATSGIASEYGEKLWPANVAGRRTRYDYDGGESAAYPPAGYLWTNAAVAGIPLRNYGFFVTNTPQPASPGEPQVQRVRDPVLAKVTNLKYRGIDAAYPDVERAKVFLADLAEWEKSGAMPRLVTMRLCNDRSGSESGIADNDEALGMIVQALTASKFWAETAIVVVEAGAPLSSRDGRSPAWILSPWTRRNADDPSPYNTASALRTVEAIIGLRPFTQFDAAARPMFAAFSQQPDVRPWEAVHKVP